MLGLAVGRRPYAGLPVPWSCCSRRSATKRVASGIQATSLGYVPGRSSAVVARVRQVGTAPLAGSSASEPRPITCRKRSVVTRNAGRPRPPKRASSAISLRASSVSMTPHRTVRAANLRDVQHQPGPYQLQAAIAAVHDEAPSVEATDWAQIVALYEVLLQGRPQSHRRAESRGRRGNGRAGPRAGLALLGSPSASDPHLAPDSPPLRSLRAHLFRNGWATRRARVAAYRLRPRARAQPRPAALPPRPGRAAEFLISGVALIEDQVEHAQYRGDVALG